MKKSKINIGILTAFLIIAIFGHCKNVKINRESKIGEQIKITASEVKLEDVLTPPTNELAEDLVGYYMNEVPKTR